MHNISKSQRADNREKCDAHREVQKEFIRCIEARGWTFDERHGEAISPKGRRIGVPVKTNREGDFEPDYVEALRRIIRAEKGEKKS